MVYIGMIAPNDVEMPLWVYFIVEKEQDAGGASHALYPMFSPTREAGAHQLFSVGWKMLF